MARARTPQQIARRQQRFLEQFCILGNVSAACLAAGRQPRCDVYDWLHADPDFAAAFRVAEEEATEHLEAEARRRAVDGLERKKFTRAGEPLMDPATGQQYVEREYSDTLLVVLLKARAPEKYRERSDVTLNARIQDVTGLTDGERTHRLRALLAAVDGPPPG